MRDLQELSKRIAGLVELLSEMGGLEVKAEIRFDDGPPGIHEPAILVHLSGPDTPMLTADNGRVLDAIETVSLDMLGLTGVDREKIRFDAGNFLADQAVRLKQLAWTAIHQVEFTGTPHVFPPMSARKRKLLGDALTPSGMSYETLGQQSARWVILFPKEMSAQLGASQAQYSSHD